MIRLGRIKEDEMLNLRETLMLYWIISPDKTVVVGPSIEMPKEPEGWFVVGVLADKWGSILGKSDNHTP